MMPYRLMKMFADIANAIHLQRAAAVRVRELEKNRCAVCLTLLNRAGPRLENCLRTLRRQSVPESCVDITLCDLGSTPDICDELSGLAQKYRVRLVRLNLPSPEWQRSWPMNIAIRHSAPDAAYVLATDIDMIYAPNFIEWVLRCHLARPDKMFVKCQIHDLPDDTVMRRHDAVEDYYKILSYGTLDRDPGIGACQSLPRKWIYDVHGYDERFRGWGREDNDMLRRVDVGRLSHVDISSRTSFVHQWHETHEQRMAREGVSSAYKEALQRNDAIFKDNIRARTLVCNPNGWGVFPPAAVVLEPRRKMKIAVASSGLGHVSRGIETWAYDTALALATLGEDVTLFCGKALASQDAALRVVPLACLRRDEKPAQWLVRLTPGAVWRWGLTGPYGWEQLSFWFALWPQLRRGRYDILHVQDPMLALLCHVFRKKGWVATREILAHGSEESEEFLAQFDYVQHLAPWHFEQQHPVDRPCWTAIPNFVDTATFTPAADGGAVAWARRKFGIPDDAFVIGTSAAVVRSIKRIDFLIEAFADLLPHGLIHGRKPYLLIAGAWHKDAASLQKMADGAAPGRVKIMTNVPRVDMPDVYRAMDICVLCSLFEMMPISILEALSCGVPVLANRHPVCEWMVGPGGACLEMTRRAVLADFLAGMPAEWPAATGRAARRHAVAVFSADAVIGRYVDYYRKVLDQSENATAPHG